MSAAVEISGLEFRYADGFRLGVASLRVEAGEHVLLAGGSGCGKSTLLHLVAGLEDASGGSIHVAGTAIGTLRGAARDAFRGRTIGMVFQTHHLLPGFSARENLLVAMMASSIPEADRGIRADMLLAAVGIDTNDRDRPADRLSVGQQQRVAVARAVAAHPVLVLADEPTASLDPANAGAAIELLRATCRAHGAALLCTSHDPSMRVRFDRVVDLEEWQGAPHASKGMGHSA
ncbi:MAG: ATP-binding cassette domain-containing protein [Planctomycetota bacterium]|nr:ATP-binding cassette domain-containing protein [Planctomycetota bacterium]MDA1105067.1 ATP-binding cassette domain-containing protein [Planctomycetota bacterium]